VRGLSKGKNNYNAIYKQIKTKFQKGQIRNVSAATGAKMAAGGLWASGAATGGTIGAGLSALQRTQAQSSGPSTSTDNIPTLHPVQMSANADGSNTKIIVDPRDADLVLKSH